MKQTAKIKNWKLVAHPHSSSGADYALVGTVTDHPKQNQFLDEVQITSALESIDFVNNVAETLNTTYTLVGPNETSN